MERKTIAINKDLAKKISEISKKKGKTIYAYINEILSAALDANELGLDFNEIISKSHNLDILRDTNLIFVSRDVYELTLNFAYPDHEDEINEKSLEYGKWVGSYAKVRFPGKEIDTIKSILESLYSRSEEKYSLIFGEGEKVTFQRYSIFHNPNRMKSESYIYEGIFSEFGYKLKSRKVTESDYELVFFKNENS
ncbi:MAG: hypothetical protein ACTSVY_06995 [Candidatus Helarchaeota archaeon]